MSDTQKSSFAVKLYAKIKKAMSSDPGHDIPATYQDANVISPKADSSDSNISDVQDLGKKKRITFKQFVDKMESQNERVSCFGYSFDRIQSHITHGTCPRLRRDSI